MSSSFSVRLIIAIVLVFSAVIGTHSTVLAGSPTIPITYILSADGTFINDFDCSFPLIEEVSGSIRDTLFFDQSGNLTREFLSPQFQGALTVTWTNPATGTSLSSFEASSLIIYYNPDGSFRKIMNQGLTFMVTVPGAGSPLLADVGRIVIERGQGVTFEAGPHMEFNGDTAAFCEYLASSH
ncbi:MAG: hypothetical protein ACM3MF_06390 [Anaerolineae bacterium]